MYPNHPAAITDISQPISKPPKPKLHGPGRPRALDDAKRREICALIAGGCGLQDAARYVDCSVSTIRREADRNPDFLQQLRHSENQAQLSPLTAMQHAIRTHWRAAAWFLERAFPDRFTRPEPSAFGTREARELMNEVLEVVDTVVQDPFVSRRLKRGTRRAFDRYIRMATDRRRNARNFRLKMKSVQNAADPVDPSAAINELFAIPTTADSNIQ